MKNVLVLDYLPATANEYINALKSHRFVGQRIKNEETERVWAECKMQGVSHFSAPVRLHFKWYTNRRLDLDNIAFSKKFVIDGLVRAQVLKNDTMKEVAGFTDTFYKGEDGVIVEITEV